MNTPQAAGEPSSARQPAMDHHPAYDGPEALLEAVRRLAPEITARAAEIEGGRSIPQDLARKIADTGLFRAMRPRALGGAEHRVPDMVPIIEELARADGSVGWSCMLGAEIPIVWQRLPEVTLQEIFGADPDALARGAIAPRPGIVSAEGGVRVNGRWPLASGSYDNAWIFVGGPVATPDGRPALDQDGQRDMRLVLLPWAQVKQHDNWDSLGLRATESHDVSVDDVFVPDARTAPWTKLSSDGPRIGRLPLILAVAPFHLGVVLGIARGMIDDLVDLAHGRRAIVNPAIRMGEDTLFQHRLGGLETRLAAARCFALSEAERAWALGASSEPAPPLARARLRAAAAHVHSECMAIANDVYALAGASVLYASSTLQRRFRDLRSACQHVVGNDEIFVPYGALLVGETPAMLAML